LAADFFDSCAPLLRLGQNVLWTYDLIGTAFNNNPFREDHSDYVPY